MESVICPSQYTRKYEDWDLSDIVKDLNRGWNTQRIKSTSQWNTKIDSSNIDFLHLLIKYYLQKTQVEFITQMDILLLDFFASDIDNFTSWDRIRWISDNFAQTNEGDIELVSTTIQYRYGATSLSLGSWSTAITGALPDTLGLDISTLTSAVVEVKINLHTDDVTE